MRQLAGDWVLLGAQPRNVDWALMRTYLVSLALWLAVVAVLLVIGFVVVRRFRRNDEADKVSTSDMMNAVRDLRVRGQISEDE